MGVQCGTLRGGGSLAYRTLEGGGGALPNTLLDVKSIPTLQCFSYTTLERGGRISNAAMHCTAMQCTAMQ